MFTNKYNFNYFIKTTEQLGNSIYQQETHPAKLFQNENSTHYSKL